MCHPPDYIDNTSDERTLLDVLGCLLVEWDERELDIASGFFKPKVWETLAEVLRRAGFGAAEIVERSGNL